MTLALRRPLPTQGKTPTHAHHPWPGRDVRGSRWSGLPPSTSGAQARTTLRGARGRRGGRHRSLPPSRAPSALLTSPVRREEVPRRVLCCAGMRVHRCAGRGGPALGRPPFYRSVPSPAHRPTPEEAGPGRSGPRGAERRYPLRGTESEPRANVWDVAVTWYSGRATRLLANDLAGTAGGSAPWPLSSS